MRSPLLLLLAGAAAAVLVAGSVLLWAVTGRPSDHDPPGEVVVGESPAAGPLPPSDAGIVAPPPPVTDHDGDGTPDEDDPDHTGPSETPSVPPSETPGHPPTVSCGDDDGDDDDDCGEDDDGDDDDD
ncbi:hypothetical protein A6A08_19200 [Nocardiopsis sp. TSRI0078]|uniref:hypothetical protein n=1 Tax=unclassified Nocardiopsis TaxID=2649073 RepID=UPI00093E8545|nr:hypothetical protein [Nocardiopsis sp. TSRI0078]OKI22399.1 hypothetical protein A6A08_19200 [Nocardiopsis sp. TSRI0078]